MRMSLFPEFNHASQRQKVFGRDLSRECTEFLAWYGPASNCLRELQSCSASAEQADGLTCDDVFRCTDLCDFCNAPEFF
jgi:polyferredoxin